MTDGLSEAYDMKKWDVFCENNDLLLENDQLKAENEKLRWLVRFIMHQCNDGNPRCEECIGWNDGECVSLSRMRELGIEVDA